MKKELTLEMFYSPTDKKAKYRIVEPKEDGKFYYPIVMTQYSEEGDEDFEKRAIKTFDEYIERRKIGEKGKKTIKSATIELNQ